MKKIKNATFAIADYLIEPANKIFSEKFLKDIVEEHKGKKINLYYQNDERKKIGIVKNLKMFGKELIGNIYIKNTKQIKEEYLTPAIFVGIRDEIEETRAKEKVYTIIMGDLMSLGLCKKNNNPYINSIKIK